MSTVSQSVPNFLSGISQQPDNRKRPGQVKDAVNTFPDFALGMLKRPGGKFVSNLRGATPDGKWFEILRDSNEKYIAQYDDNVFRVWDLDGDNRMVNMGANTGVPNTCFPGPGTNNGNNVQDLATALNAARAEVTRQLGLLQTAEVVVAEATAGRQTNQTTHWDTDFTYTDEYEEKVRTGITELSSGTHLIIEDNAVKASLSYMPDYIVDVVNGGANFTNGKFSNIATTTTGNGVGLRVNLTVAEGVVTNAEIHTDHGTGTNDDSYESGEILGVTGYANVTLRVFEVSKGTERTNEHPLAASKGYKLYELVRTLAEVPQATLTAAENAYNTVLTNYNNAVTALGTAETNYDNAVTACAIAAIPADRLTITNAGSNFANGTTQDVTQAAASTSGVTTALFDVTVTNGAISAIAFAQDGDPGTFLDNDVITLTGFAGAQITYERGGYLSGATADDIELLTLNDSTFVLNKAKTVRMTLAEAHATGLAANRAHVVITIAANSTNYVVTINGTDVTITSPVSAATASGIAQQLATAVNNINGITATAIGPGLYITGTNAFTISTASATTSEAIFAITNTTSNITKLPLQAENGYVVEVINSQDIDIDNQFLEFRTDDPNQARGTGQWFETAAPGVRIEFDPLTMPHRLVSQADQSFTFEAVTWDQRIIGDDETNPIPSFVGGRIDHIFFYRNRLGFLSGQNVILSKAADLFDFWNTTAQTATDDDPIDISVAGKKPVFLHYVQPTSVGLVLYSSVEQFLLTTDSDILSPKTAKVNTLSNYECDPNVEAQSLGISQAFISKTPLFTRLFELNDIATDRPPLASDITNIVPELIPSTVNTLKASAGLSLVSLGQTGSSTMYHYRFLNSSREQRVVNSWYKWELTGLLLAQFFDNSTFYTVVRNGNDVYLQSYDVSQSNEQGFLSLPTGEKTDVCLDLFQVNPHRTYDDTDDETRIFLPFDEVTDKTLNVLVLGDFIGGTPTLTSQSVGAILTPEVEGNAGNQFVDISGDYRGRNLIIGYGYDMTVDLPRLFKYIITGEDISNDDASSLIVHRLKFKLGLSGPVDYKVSITGIDPFTKDVTVTLPQQYNLNNVNMQASSTHVVPIFQRNENLAVQIIGNTPFPVSLLGLDWEGKLNQRFYRRG